MPSPLSLYRQNRYREQYRAVRPGWRPATEVYEALIRQQLRPGMRVLDLGCGRGGVLEQLGATVSLPVGIDPDLASLREHRLPTLSRAQAMAGALPFATARFDLVLASWVFEHLPSPVHTLREIRRVLRPGGALVFLTPNRLSLVALLNQALRPFQKILVQRIYGRAEADTFPVTYRANTVHRLHELAARAGYRHVSLVRVSDPTYLAFTPALFRLSSALAAMTPPVHLVGILAR